MEKKIKLVIYENKNIEILVNDNSKFIIEENNRKISAQDIYDLINYKSSEQLIVTTDNEKNIDSNVLNFFKELLEDICKRINELDFKEEDSIIPTPEENAWF